MSNLTKILLEKAVKTVKRKVFEESQLILEPEVVFAERLAKWCEAKRKKKDELGLSNDYVAEKTKVSQATIGRIMSGSMDKDIRWSTVIAVDRLLPTEKPPAVSIDLASLVAAFEAEAARIREDAAREIALYKDKIAALEAQAAEMKALITMRGEIINKLIDKID